MMAEVGKHVLRRIFLFGELDDRELNTFEQPTMKHMEKIES